MTTGPRASLLLLALPALFALACGTDATEGALDGEGIGDGESAIVPLTEPDETAPTSDLAPAPLDKDAAGDLIDVRGVGDAAWSKTHEETPLAPAWGPILDRFDRSGQSYRGDLSFLNWETVVGNGCSAFATRYVAGRNYAFVSRPENLVQARERGFQLVGLSNNHARDCVASADTPETGELASADMTARGIENLGDRDWLVAGVASTQEPNDFKRARVGTFEIKGRKVTVAFGSLYTGRASCPRTTCAGDANALFASMRDAKADLRILAMHSMAAADQDELVRLGIRFVREFGGDVVFGHGPHVWKPVRVVAKSGGGKGVIFESLGNFLHPSLAAQSKNIIGRALFDKDTLALRQVQVLPVANAGTDLTWSNASARELDANLVWSPAPRGAFANVKR
jgi:hypothetical protein